MIQGSNQARTARSALGQDTCGRLSFPTLIFFPFLLPEQERLSLAGLPVQIAGVVLPTCWKREG
jgi:hypothetical protein